MNKLASICAIALAGCLTAGSANAQQHDAPAFINVASHSSFDTDFTMAAEKTINAVVCIKNFATPSQGRGGYYGNGSEEDFFDFFDFFGFGNRRQQQPQQRQQQPRNNEPVERGMGSGVILSSDGYIVTNNHVIDGAERIEVLLNDNSTYQAKVIGTDEATDLALIKIDADGLSPITFGDSDDLKIGEWVLAVGNPFGFNSTVTAGIVSAKARSIGQSRGSSNMTIESFIQTDAALNPGNSGGALVNLNGELVGINSAIYSNTGSYAGFSFAIPTSIVSKVMSDLKNYGSVQRAVLGVTISELTPKLAEEKDITAVKSGLVVVDVNDMSTGKELGLKKDDVIVAINDVPVSKMSNIQEQMQKYRPGQEITVTFYRDNKKYTKTATLRNQQGTTSLIKKNDFTCLGAAFMKLNTETKDHLGISNGVQVTGLRKGLLSEQGVREGFIIQEINKQKVNSSDDVEMIFDNIMKDPSADRVMILYGIYPTGKKTWYAIPLDNDDDQTDK